MIRQIIHIDEEKCNGCGICANACHEGAIDIVDGKAKLVRENFCDGFGDCLPGCPMGAITFEQREAPDYDEAAVKASKASKAQAAAGADTQEQLQDEKAAAGAGKAPEVKEAHTMSEQAMGLVPDDAKKAEIQAKMQQMHAGGGCPGSRIRQMNRSGERAQAAEAAGAAKPMPMLTNWPVQIKLAPIKAPYFEGAKLLIAADCTAYAYAAFHQDFIRGKVTLIGCPKLDAIDYSEKLTQIIAQNEIQSVTIVRMEVPCCGGLEMAAKKALQASGKFIPWQVVTISIDGHIMD